MVFSSLTFLFLFFPVLLTSYFVIPANYRSKRNALLLLFSVLFYSFGGWNLIPIIFCSLLINYLSGRLVSSHHSHYRRFAIVGCIICNLALLIFYKYFGFITSILHFYVPSLPIVKIVLPIGISFYTFQGLSYVIDVYRGNAKSESNFIHVALYMTLFPQLVAGPIVRYRTIADQIDHRRETLDDFVEGSIRFLFGLSKKVLIANQLGQIADAAFNQSPTHLSSGVAWIGILAYTLQIYFDFSGYSDMAIGLGRIFGFHFLENFNHPYIADSITDFWRRWHISLSSWFKDYLYIPLGGNRVSLKRQIGNLLIVWTLTGLWHGAAWNFLFWGLYYAILLIGERYIWGKILKKSPRLLKHTYALLLILLGRLIFRSTGVIQIQSFLLAMVGANGAGLWSSQASYFILQYRWELLFGILFSLPISKIKLINTEFFSKLKPFVALLLGFLSIMRLISSNFNPFIYFQF